MKRPILLFLFSFLLFVVSCSSNKGTMKALQNSFAEKILSENPWLKSFIKDFFLDSGALYTIFGNKPLTSVEIIYASEEQWRLKIKERFKDQPEIKEKALAKLSQYYSEYHLKELWLKWLKLIENYPELPFLFGEYDSEVPEIKFGYVLNKQEALWILMKYKHLFEEKIKENFDPISLINEFGKLSKLWEIILSDDLLSGLLYGYGLRNSELFVLRKKLREEKKNRESFFSQVNIATSNAEISLDNLSLPMMTSFQLPFDNDPVVREYENQRKRIQRNLTQKNFEEAVIQQIIH